MNQVLALQQLESKKDSKKNMMNNISTNTFTNLNHWKSSNSKEK
ncbi:class III lanthipeptide [Chengkuizengella sediminis]|nr:class III lanthipeptide [Chengkuizengella sediminis]